jgi:excisionase family DNA binding protein
MEVITSFSRTELEQIISDTVTKCLEAKLSPLQPEIPDRCTLIDACEITGLGKAAIYKAVGKKEIPYSKFGSRLIFSRKELVFWVESHTLPSSSPDDEMTANLVKSAQKHLRNAK